MAREASPAKTHEWIVLTYKVPAEPAARRIAVWRKLKAMGAVYLQNGVCVLPKTAEHLRRTKSLERDVADMGGEAILMQTASMDRRQEEKILARFASERDQAYGEFIIRCDDFEAEIARERAIDKFIYAEVEENEEDLAKLRAWLDKIVKLDFFGAPRRQEASERLARCAGILDDYASEVYARELSETTVNTGKVKSTAGSKSRTSKKHRR